MSLFEWVLVLGLVVTAWLGSLALFLRGLCIIRAPKEYEDGPEVPKKVYGLVQMVVGAIGIVLWGSITVLSIWNRFQGQ